MPKKAPKLILDLNKISNDLQNSPEHKLTFTSYPKLCSYLGLRVLKGDSKIAQLKQLSTILKFEINEDKSLSILDINKTPISQKQNITIDLFKVYQDIELSPQHQLLFNNYIHFCWYLKIPILYGNQKISQLNKLHKLMDFEIISKNSNFEDTFLIKKSYWNIIDPMNQDAINCFKCIHKSGVYKIYNNDKIYIGSSKNLYRRFMEHFKNYQNECEKTHEILENNGFFEIIEIVDNISEFDKFDKNLQTKEYEYIKDYIFNYSIGQENKILINSVIPDKTGNLINLGKRLQVKFLKNKNKKLDKNTYTRLKINDNDINNVINLLDQNNISYEIINFKRNKNL